MLCHLLHPENDTFLCVDASLEQPSYSRAVICQLVEQPASSDVRVLLDVGAQMLDMNNWQVVDYWLKLRKDVNAAIFFDEFDIPQVLTQDGRIEAYATSSFNRQIAGCVIYLDDAHTRGTDLPFPSGFRAAVTLGPNVTKDRLLQGVQI